MGMVPVIKTLIPYVPRDYCAERAPLTDGNNVEQDAERATAEKTEEIVARNDSALAEFQKAFARYQELTDLQKQGLCSKARLDKQFKVLAETQYTWMKGHIPAAYAVLDPLQVDIEGPMELPWLRARTCA